MKGKNKMFEDMTSEEIVNELMKLGTIQQKEIMSEWMDTLYEMLGNLTKRIFELMDDEV